MPTATPTPHMWPRWWGISQTQTKRLTTLNKYFPTPRQTKHLITVKTNIGTITKATRRRTQPSAMAKRQALSFAGVHEADAAGAEHAGSWPR